jgi:hypothetical protein
MKLQPGLLRCSLWRPSHARSSATSRGLSSLAFGIERNWCECQEVFLLLAGGRGCYGVEGAFMIIMTGHGSTFYFSKRNIEGASRSCSNRHFALEHNPYGISFLSPHLRHDLRAMYSRYSTRTRSALAGNQLEQKALYAIEFEVLLISLNQHERTHQNIGFRYDSKLGIAGPGHSKK